MEQFNDIYNLGSEVQLLDRQSYITQSTKLINRQVFRMHSRHLVAWLLRAAVILYLFYLGTQIVDGVIGEALIWTAGILLACLLFYISRGHCAVQRFRAAKMYWLRDDAASLTG